MTLTPARRRRPPRRRRAWPLVVALIALGAVGVAVALGMPHRPNRHASATSTGEVRAPVPVRRSVEPRPAILVEHGTGALASPVQDAAAAPVPGGAMLLGGLTAADQSRTDIRIATAATDRAAGTLPTSLHDTAAVTIGSAVYLFGGGTGASTQSDQIVRVAARGGAATVVAHLQAPSSDQSAAVVAGTAYVVGGYTGSQWLDTIVAWRPGGRPHIVAHLPEPLRYAAVAATRSTIVIAGGSRENGTASATVLAFRPGSTHVTRIGRLPAATTHAAAATLGDVVYVIGGRGAALGTPTARIVSVDPSRKRIRPAGSLAGPRSDLAAVTVGRSILLAGGRGTGGTEAGLSELAPATTPKPQRVAASADVYGHDRAGELTGAARLAKPLVYVPNSGSDTVDVIDPHSYKVVEHFPVGGLPQHVVPSWDLRTLYVTNDIGNSLTAIDPRTGKPGRTIPVEDPYNMYFTPNGRFAIVVAERLHRLDFRDAHSFTLRHSLDVPCRGVDHMDFSADGRYLLASCEFSGSMVVVDVAQQRVVRTVTLPDGAMGMPQDVKISPDGRLYYVADMHAGGLWEIDARSYRVLHFQATGAGAHGLYPSRDTRFLYVSNRSAGTISVLRFATRRVVATWRIPGGTPDMGGVSADGKVLWLSGRYRSEVYAVSTVTGKLLARIPVGAGPHGLSVWPQPGRFSLGHTGILR
ncbi:MAG: YVTN family beta-propeller repeat protein [Gaiellaceae bacterium]